MKYPTAHEVDNATQLQVCRWWRFLRVTSEEELVIMNNHIYPKFKEFGGFTPEISKQIGWNAQ